MNPMLHTAYPFPDSTLSSNDELRDNNQVDVALVLITFVGTLHRIKHQSLHLQRLAPLMWSLIAITLKPQEEEAKIPDDSKINQKKLRISLTRLYAN